MKKIGLVILFLGVVALVGGARLLRLYSSDAIHAERKVDIYLPNSTSLHQLSFLLVDSLHMVHNKKEFKWAASLLGWRTFQPGHYKIDHDFTYDQFLSKLAKGNQDPISVTIVPGLSKTKILLSLAEHMRFDSSAICETLNDSSFLAHRNITQKSLVGHLFPATYELYWTAQPKVVVERIFNEFNKQVNKPYRKQAKKLDLTLNKMLALASIVEWEARHDDEKPKISGLYWNRLKKGMPLQADPTVSYAVDEQRRLYYKDYKIDSPYNTYIHKGLPPGPINNPSLSSIKAALHPQKSDYLFMVAQPNGYHAFSKTYAKHEQQSAKWRKYLKEKSTKQDSTSASN